MRKIKLFLFSLLSVGLFTGCFIFSGPPEERHPQENYLLADRSFGPEIKDSSEIGFKLPWTTKSLASPLLVFDLDSPRMESRHYMQLDTVISLLKNIPGLRVDMCRNNFGEISEKELGGWDSHVRNWGGEYKENGDRVYREILDYFEKNGITVLQRPKDLVSMRRCWTYFPVEDSLTGDGEMIDWLYDRIRQKFPEKLIIRFEVISSQYNEYQYASESDFRCLIVFPVK